MQQRKQPTYHCKGTRQQQPTPSTPPTGPPSQQQQQQQQLMMMMMIQGSQPGHHCPVQGRELHTARHVCVQPLWAVNSCLSGRQLSSI